ncbi:MAG: hypothetical protein R3D25_07730 [Geminicoccaceae bacterium]
MHVARMAVAALSVLLAMAAVEARAQGEAPLLSLDFADYRPADGSVRDWLTGLGFDFAKAADDDRKIAVSVEDGVLQVDTKKQAFGVIYHEGDVPGATRLRVTWGVDVFPRDVGYEKAVNNEALMIYVFFGREKMPSGSIFIPDVSYFIGFYLCDSDRIDHPYTGRYHHESGRFVCLAHPKPGETVVSEVDLAAAFEAYFGKAAMPTISGISLEVDTSNAGDGGKAKAFLEKVELLP